MQTIMCPEFTPRDTRLLGAALCMRQVFALNGGWAPLRTDLSFVHSEPAAIMLFLGMVDSLAEEPPSMEYLLTVRRGRDVEYEVRYWSHLLGEPMAMFDSPVERSRVTIPDSGDLYQEVDRIYCTYLEALDFEVAERFTGVAR
jgi:hypothetical protein